MNDLTARDQAARALISRERYGDALRALERAATTSGEGPKTLALRAEALAGLAEFDKAEQAAQAALTTDPHCARALFVLGTVADSREQKQAAIDYFGRALHEDARFAPAHYASGRILMQSGQVDIAAQHFAVAQALEPQRWRYIAAAALALPPRERYKQLRAAYGKGLVDHPRSLRLKLRYLATYAMAPLSRMMPDHARADPRVSASTMDRLTQRTPVLTYLLLAANAAVFAWMETHGGSSNGQVLDRYGAEDPALIVHHGDWWRLVTPMFLHAGITHLSVNALSLYFVGTVYERFVGKARFLFVYFASGIGGAILSLAALPDLGVGASGAIFGIFAGLGAFALLNRRVLGVVSGRLLRSVVGLSALNLMTPILDPHIDGWAHAGGLLTGIVCGLLVGPLLSTSLPDSHGGRDGDDTVSARARLQWCAVIVGSLIGAAWLVILINPAGA